MRSSGRPIYHSDIHLDRSSVLTKKEQKRGPRSRARNGETILSLSLEEKHCQGSAAKA
ncbi:unnamed protein product [Amoebophrya sp. A25]|nr:unnamed protein product [Amoebophrya sp. A25]|eukprot:GSA25T00018908001.1